MANGRTEVVDGRAVRGGSGGNGGEEMKRRKKEIKFSFFPIYPLSLCYLFIYWKNSR